jgi:hypothetical protein
MMTLNALNDFLGYTRTKKTAHKSKLVVYIGLCDCNCYDNLPLSLLQIYKWFTAKNAEFSAMEAVT